MIIPPDLTEDPDLEVGQVWSAIGQPSREILRLSRAGEGMVYYRSSINARGARPKNFLLWIEVYGASLESSAVR
jgi:hypothetical protein